jgi:hypothetical protein
MDGECPSQVLNPKASCLLSVTAYNGDAVNPDHYKSHPSGVECIQVTEHMNFCLGNALKYIWRAGLKGDAVEDLRKARWYLDREIGLRESGNE